MKPLTSIANRAAYMCKGKKGGHVEHLNVIYCYLATQPTFSQPLQTHQNRFFSVPQKVMLLGKLMFA